MNRSGESISERLQKLSLEKNINKTDIDALVQEVKGLEESQPNIRREEESMAEERLRKSHTSRDLFEHDRGDKIYIQVEKTMNPTQPLFGDNNKMDVEDWLFITNQNLISARVNEDERGQVASGYLRGLPAQFYRMKLREYNVNMLSWEEVKELLISKYKKRNKELSITSQLYQLAQTDSVANYIEKFTYLINQTDELTEPVKICMFTNNINKEIAKEIEYKEPKSLEDAFHIAMKY